MHPGQRYGTCAHCARAAVATEAALSSTIPLPIGQRTHKRGASPNDVTRARELRASGMGIRAIARTLNMKPQTVSDIVANRSHVVRPSQSDPQRRMHQLALGPKGAKKQARETHMPLRDGVG